jgi:hypothetical protein
MKKTEKELFSRYKIVLENENISNGQMSQVSTNFQVDHNAKFLPIGQDVDDEEKTNLKSSILKHKLKEPFTSLKTLIASCESKTCSIKSVSELLSMLDNPRFKSLLTDLKQQLQTENQEAGTNAKLAF